MVNFVKHIFKHYSTSKDQAPCMNCLLIEMGEMACYQERCPQCGRIPPGRKALPGKKFKTMVGRTLSANKNGKNTISGNGVAGTHQPAGQNPFPLSLSGHGGQSASQLQHPSELNLQDYNKKYSLRPMQGSLHNIV